jgi:DNA replication protein DnaC
MMNDFCEKMKRSSEEYEAKEKAEWDALSEEEKQRIITEREQERVKEEKDRQISAWKDKGITERYFNASWENWIANTPGKKKAIANAKKAWKENLFLTGKNGTGKTYLAMCLTKEGATYRNAEDIFQELRSDFDHEKEILDFYGSRKLLIIDEVGRQNKKELSDFEKNKFFEIINRRWNNCLPTTLIANMGIKEVVDLLGTAILDRLRPIFVPFDWESMRGEAG